MFSTCPLPSPPTFLPVQDLYLDHLTSKAHGLEEELDLLEVQRRAQAQDTKAVKEALTDATMELEVCAVCVVQCGVWCGGEWCAVWSGVRCGLVWCVVWCSVVCGV